MKKTVPFELSKEQSFYDSLGDWIGDTLYDELTEKGFECRDEQIFMAFQIEQALKEKTTLFAEAGVGTGKTIAYLLPAIAYARYTGKPALLSCADETLIEQLVKQEGDIAKLSRALNLEIDVRMAKARDQYICLKRLDEASDVLSDPFIEEVEDAIPDFVYGSHSLQSVYPYGERSNFPQLNDAEWDVVNYHPIEQCSACDLRNRCGQTLHRDHYRKAPELLICSHDFYMEHIWTKESRERQGQLPLLPEVSMIVFDEGHLLEYSAQRALTYEVQNETLIQLLERIMVDDIREKTLYLMEHLLEAHDSFFALVDRSTEETNNTRKSLEKSTNLLQMAKQLVTISNALLEEFVFEGELYTIPAYDLKMVEEYLEQYIYSLNLFISEEDVIDWVEDREGALTVIIMPRLVTDILREKLFQTKTPIIFSSATLSIEKDFTYLANGLGIEKYASFSVPSPFDYEESMRVQLEEVIDQEKANRAMQKLTTGDQTLILFKSFASMRQFAKQLTVEQRASMVFEGEREISSIVRDFQHKKVQVFCTYRLWEGLDIPNDALTQVIIYDLPFPPNDPLFEAKRVHAERPFAEVDLPFMQLRFRQGIGRLIRTSSDAGSIHVLLDEQDIPFRSHIVPLFPIVVQ